MITVVGELTADDRSIVLIADGPDHEVAYAAKKLQLLTPLIKPSQPAGALILPVSWPAVVQLSTTFAGAWNAGPRLAAWTAEQVRARTEFPDRLSVTPPAGLEPRSYQVEAATLIRATGSTLIFDEPGLGKTVSTVLGLVERAAAGFDVTPIVIVCPAAVVDSWVSHFRAWAPFWKATAWRGTPNFRARLGHANAHHIYVCSYDTARRDCAPDKSTKQGYSQTLMKLGARSIVADEVHKIKAHQTQQSRAVRRLAAKALHFIGLSGTPITHNPADLWPALEALSPGAWPSRERWVMRYCDSLPGDYGENILGLRPSNEPEFRTTLIGQHRRVAKADVAKELPPKIYSVRTVELPAEYRRAYDEMEHQMLAELPDGGELSVMGVLAQLTRLSQMACAAADVRVETEVVWDDDMGCEIEKQHQHVTLKNPSWKVAALLEVLEERCGPEHGGEQVVAFAPSKQLIVLAGAAAEKAGYRVGYVMGGQTAKSRTAQVDAFQAGELDVMCVVTQAGGVGITLTAARTAVFLQRPWSLVDAIQAEDRCFTADTPVLTANGWVPIQNIAVGDMVVTHTGDEKPVIDAWSQQTKHQLMAEVSITGQETVVCTVDHRFLLRDGTWREAGQLRPGDWLAVPGNEMVDELRTLRFDAHRVEAQFLNSWGAEQANGRLKRADDYIEVTDDFLYTLGYFAGDGFASIAEGKGRFISLSGNPGRKAAALDRCEHWARSVDLTGKRRTTPGTQRAEQRFYSADWAHWFHAQFGGQTGARHKQLPAFVRALNSRQSAIVLDGLADSDGYRRAGSSRCEYSTVSPRLAANVAHLAMRAGHRTALANGSTGQQIVAFGGAPGPRNPGRVRSVLLRHNRKERVYDLTVQDAQTFVVGGVVVHNCHRIGAEHESIEVIDVVARKTIDTRIRQVLRERAGQLSDLVQDRRIVAELLGGASVSKIKSRSAA